MNTYQRQLLHALIEGLMNATPTPELHTHQMLAAELKGAMQAQADLDGQSDPQSDPQIDTPTPDADGWIENTGVMPTCEISAIKFKSGRIEETTEKDWHWPLGNEFHTITHYRPE